MQSDDKNINGQQHPNTPSFLDLLDQAASPSATGPDKDPGTNLAQLRAAWTASWEQGGFLHGRWEELLQVPQAGWHGMANFLQTLTCLMRQMTHGRRCVGGRPSGTRAAS
uniref:hypothetical protein n=1 Tax=Streptomyces sp. NBC_00998 TaxID=2903712 RepID=UPI002F910D94|nr:hypothetical protein OG513_39000 [Streptomyces sp. NBC_00998]